MDWALVVSIAALAVSATTAWLTLFRRGDLKMTRPSVIFFGHDSTPDRPEPKVYFRALLFSTSNRGQLVENLHVKLRLGETTQNFTVWVYGDKDNLERGSGLYVGKEGIAKNHHFLLAPDRKGFAFDAGEYKLAVFATLVNRPDPIVLVEERLVLSPDAAASLSDKRYGVYFDWGPDSKKYYSRLDLRPEKVDWTPILKSVLAPGPQVP